MKVYNFLQSIIANIRARLTAQPFNIHTEEIDYSRPMDIFLLGDWLADDSNLYYGHPCFVFFISAQNAWWQKRREEKSNIN